MGFSTNILRFCSTKKGRTRGAPKMSRIDFNHGTGDATVNYRGWMSDRYRRNPEYFEGLFQLLALAGISGGWKKGAPVARHDVDLVDFALISVAASVPKSKSYMHALERKRASKEKS